MLLVNSCQACRKDTALSKCKEVARDDVVEGQHAGKHAGHHEYLNNIRDDWCNNLTCEGDDYVVGFSVDAATTSSTPIPAITSQDETKYSTPIVMTAM